MEILLLILEELISLGRQKKGNPNAQRNNNAKKMEKRSQDTEFANYAEVEAEKMNSHKQS